MEENPKSRGGRFNKCACLELHRLLILLTYFGLVEYQNFVNNAFLWLLVGILYRLPKLAQMPQPVPARTGPRARPIALAVCA
jgi:hypothetical protein